MDTNGVDGATGAAGTNGIDEAILVLTGATRNQRY